MRGFAVVPAGDAVVSAAPPDIDPEPWAEVGVSVPVRPCPVDEPVDEPVDCANATPPTMAVQAASAVVRYLN